MAIEDFLLGKSPHRLPPNYPGIDSFIKSSGRLISVKSIAAGTGSYTDARRVVSRADSLIDELSGYKQFIPTRGKGPSIFPSMIGDRHMVMAVPDGWMGKNYNEVSNILSYGLSRQPPVYVHMVEVR